MKSNDPAHSINAKPKSRRVARRFAMQALYQWQLASPATEELIQQFLAQSGIERADASYFSEIVAGVIREKERIDTTLQQYLDRKIVALNPVECAILRLSVFEFLFRLDVPYRVVINEAIELAKEYGAVEGYKYINGVLNHAATQLREVEVRGNS